ncbi:potassium channel AKT1-like [Olea europaea subsp. europaea]|uniref:Potassium channel AKT1-like n=1 Tax=Olea europaea subsp. europaea TaxID=158383 RepID=A0A8S0VNC8_OLEEU|nr:potassium channel AKT1-like [Olea europaea subsp. europaea]
MEGRRGYYLAQQRGTTALHTAICEENIEVVKFLMEQGANIDKPDVHGGRGVFQSPLSLATPQDRARLVLSCPERDDGAKNLVLLPGSLQELLDLGYQKFGFYPTKILTKDGALIGDLAVIRHGDHLVLANGDGQQSEEHK